MYSLDTNLNIAVERQAERVQAVQAVGQTRLQNRATQSWGADAAPRASKLAGVMKAGLVTAVLAIATLLVVMASTGGAGGLVVALIK